MRTFIALLKREFMSYFYSPVAYIIMTAFLFVTGAIFKTYLVSTGNSDVLRMFIGEWSSITILMTPMITMRLFAEEKKSGTIEMLMTAPVTEAAVVLAKFAGAILFYFFIITPTLGYVVILSAYGNPDYGAIMTGYLGLILSSFIFFSIGTFVSSLTSGQIVAAVVTFFALLLLVGLEYLASFMPETIKSVVIYACYSSHLGAFAKGIVDSRDIVYFLSVTALFLFFTTISLESRRWK